MNKALWTRQFSPAFPVQGLQRSKRLPNVKRWNECLMWTGRDHEMNRPPEQSSHTFSDKRFKHKYRAALQIFLSQDFIDYIPIYKIHHATLKISLHISQMSPHNKFNNVIGYTRGGLPNAFCYLDFLRYFCHN